jgi:hypothetical protein
MHTSFSYARVAPFHEQSNTFSPVDEQGGVVTARRLYTVPGHDHGHVLKEAVSGPEPLRVLQRKEESSARHSKFSADRVLAQVLPCNLGKQAVRLLLLDTHGFYEEVEQLPR